jgi:O-antigen/teichoic acid export membrane protein
LNDRRASRLAFARLFSSAVVSQALLSAASFAIGLLLIRRSSDLQYGHYILATSAIALLVSLQNAFCGPALASQLSRLELPERRLLVGALLREWPALLGVAGLLLAAGSLGLRAGGLLPWPDVLLLVTSIAAALVILHRECLRLLLFSYQRPQDVLRTDLLFATLTVAGVFAATGATQAAPWAMVTLALAALLTIVWLTRALRRHEDWNHAPAPGRLRALVPLARWSIAGAAMHWTFSQGYVYLVAATLDVAAVAAIAATRLLLMPVNLLSTGIGSLMLPLATGWLDRHGATFLFRRLALFAAAMAALTLAWFGLLWLERDWIFGSLLRKQFAQRDSLLLLWGLLFLVMVVRDQLAYLMAAQGRFRGLTLLTLLGAIASLSASYAGMRQFGAPGALGGMLAGELITLAGILVLSWPTARRGGALPAWRREPA